MPSSIDQRFAEALRQLLTERGVSFRALAARVHYGKSHLHALAAGTKAPTMATAERIDRALDGGGRLVALVRVPAGSVTSAPLGEEVEALELARRVEASDVSGDTLDRLEWAVDELATAYPTTAPRDLLPRVREHLGYVTALVDARATLAQRRRLLTAGAWLSLLAATLDIDLRRDRPARDRLVTAGQLAGHAGHTEIGAWCLETRAWHLLNEGRYDRVVELSRRAQAVAPVGSSAYIQATAQEARGWARMGRRTETREALNRVNRLVSSLARPDRPEHHYRYDPTKAVAYTATTLAWAGDPAAEEHAREALHQLTTAADGTVRPRRVAAAQLDLGLALLAAGKPDEAAAQALAAITSGRVVPSNWWRATEVVDGVRGAGLPDVADLDDALRAFGRPPGEGQQGT